ncbi:PEBP-like protein [Phaeosphaeriaceae sp. SRC1lsM3a]|nr:PEBP-like protein [Stagonospora sp. SRC1lsM3a]
MKTLQLIEFCIGRLLYRLRGYDAQLFCNSPAFAQHPRPTIFITSPCCGETGAKLKHAYSKFGGGRFPCVEWKKPGANVKEYLMLAEDPDAPTRKPNVHGIYCSIPPHVTLIMHEELEVVAKVDGAKQIRAGYRVGKNRRDMVYIAPRPPLGHGPHRYTFQLVALDHRLDAGSLSEIPTKKEVEDAVIGRVVAWGMWQATYETEW